MIDLLQRLISFPSITPNHSGSIDFLAEVLSQHGFDIVTKEFGDKKVANLYAAIGTGLNICFAGHVDVVPTGPIESWVTDPFVATEKDGKIYGRGSVDMKGGIAAQIKAALDFITYHPNHSGKISFLITSDEEGDAEHGTKAMLDYLYKLGNKIDFAIIAEPTCVEQVGDTIKIGSRGSANFTLDVFGAQGHVAYSDTSNNPAHAMILILSDLISNQLDNGNGDFPASTLQVTSVDTGNPAVNVVSEKISAKFNIRFNNLHTSQSLLSLLKDKVQKYTNKFSISVQSNANPYCLNTKCTEAKLSKSATEKIKPSELLFDLKNIVMDITGIKPQISASGATSDARFFIQYCPVVEFGPLYKEAHQVNEYVDIKDLQTLYKVYHRLLESLLI